MCLTSKAGTATRSVGDDRGASLRRSVACCLVGASADRRTDQARPNATQPATTSVTNGQNRSGDVMSAPPLPRPCTSHAPAPPSATRARADNKLATTTANVGVRGSVGCGDEAGDAACPAADGNRALASGCVGGGLRAGIRAF